MAVAYLISRATELGYTVTVQNGLCDVDFNLFTIPVIEADIESMTDVQVDTFLSEGCKRGWYNTWNGL